MPVRGTELGPTAMPVASGYCSFLLLPLVAIVIHIFTHTHTCIYIQGYWKTCTVTPLSPHVPNRNELGPWDLG
jgi:hypothetical protein